MFAYVVNYVFYKYVSNRYSYVSRLVVALPLRLLDLCILKMLNMLGFEGYLSVMISGCGCRLHFNT